MRNPTIEDVKEIINKLKAEGFFAYYDGYTSVLNADQFRKPGFDEKGYWRALRELKAKNPAGYLLPYDPPPEA